MEAKEGAQLGYENINQIPLKDHSNIVENQKDILKKFVSGKALGRDIDFGNLVLTNKKGMFFNGGIKEKEGKMFIPMSLIGFFLFRDEFGIKDFGRNDLCKIFYQALVNKEYYPEENEIKCLMDFAKTVPMNENSTAQQAKQAILGSCSSHSGIHRIF